MRVLLFFNELSCGHAADHDAVDVAMKEFVSALLKIRTWRTDATLVSAVPLPSLELTPGYYLEEWRWKPANRDVWRGIRGYQNRAPYSRYLDAGAMERVEYELAGRAGLGLAAAHLEDGLLVGLLLDPAWREPYVRADRTYLEEAEDGAPVMRQDTVEIPHAACTAHADYHKDRIRRTGISKLTSGTEIWESRKAVFPALRFLPRVEEDLRTLQRIWVIPAAEELLRINDAIADWDPVICPEPRWRSDVTPESQTRITKGYADFEDLDGQVRTFSLHGRFTPRPGRIHFRLLAAENAAMIAYVGRKIGA